MKDARTVFEAIMRGNGYENTDRDESGNYVVSSLNMRWRYFLIGWEMRGVE
jgi:hypothetical protein